MLSSWLCFCPITKDHQNNKKLLTTAKDNEGKERTTNKMQNLTLCIVCSSRELKQTEQKRFPVYPRLKANKLIQIYFVLDVNLNPGNTLDSPQTYSTLLTSIAGLIDYKFIAISSHDDMIVDQFETKTNYQIGLSSGNVGGKKIKFDVSTSVKKIYFCLRSHNFIIFRCCLSFLDIS